MYHYTPDEIDYKRANHQAKAQDRKNLDVKRAGNLGELTSEQLCHECLPVELWKWKNEETIRRCNPESFSSYGFEVFGYEVDVKTPRDISAFLPETPFDNDPGDDTIAIVWHRDNEGSLILPG